MSFTSVCASAGGNPPKHEHNAKREAQKRTERKVSGPHEIVRNRTGLTFQGRSRPYFPARNIRRCNRRSSAEDISTSIGRDNITASPGWLRLFCQIFMTTQNGRPLREIHSGAPRSTKPEGAANCYNQKLPWLTFFPSARFVMRTIRVKSRNGYPMLKSSLNPTTKSLL